jgi:thioester reductase-like protein
VTGRNALITGFPKTELACWVLDEWLRSEPEGKATCIVPAQFAEAAQERLGRLEEQRRQRVTLVEGDAAHMDLGLSGPEFNSLAAQVHVIHHCAAMVYSGADARRAAHFNLHSTIEVLELAERARGQQLQRLVHWSSTRATGSIHGKVQEDFLAPPDGGKVPTSRYESEKLVREASNAGVPITVLRPANLVGDTETGTWPRAEGTYLIVRALLNSRPDTPVSLPAHRVGCLNVVPVDYAARAGCLIAAHSASIGRTFHIIDPKPLSVAEAFRLFATLTGRPEPRRGIPSPLAAALLNVPGISRLAHGQRDLVEELGRRASFDDRNARAILEPAGMRCPALAEYADKLVSFTRSSLEEPPVEASAAKRAPPV